MTRNVIQIRLTPEQRLRLDDDRGDTPLSQYVRDKLGLAQDDRPVSAAEPEVEKERDIDPRELQALATRIHFSKGVPMATARRWARQQLNP